MEKLSEKGSRSKCYVRETGVFELSLFLIHSLLSRETVFRTALSALPEVQDNSGLECPEI